VEEGFHAREKVLIYIQKEGVAKNRKVAEEGEYQINSGKFSGDTKNREGVVPGDGGRRGDL
jgi:hypothetical protein